MLQPEVPLRRKFTQTGEQCFTTMMGPLAASFRPLLEIAVTALALSDTPSMSGTCTKSCVSMPRAPVIAGRPCTSSFSR